jgi:hypothetical protein
MKTTGLSAILLLLLLACLATGRLAGQKTDTLFLKNGDRLIGEIKRLQNGYLFYNTQQAGNVQIEWENVQRLVSDKTLVVQTMDGDLLEGSFILLNPERVIIYEGTDTIFLGDSYFLNTLYSVKGRFWQRFDGNFNLGLDYTRVSNIFRSNIDLKLSYQDSKNYTDIGYNGIVTNDRNAEEQSINRTFFTNYAHFFANSWFVNPKYSLEQNSQQGIDLRHIISGQVGRALPLGRSVNTQAAAGITYNREKFFNEEIQQADFNNSLEGMLSIKFKAFRYKIPELDVSADFTLLPGLTEWGRLRIVSNLTTSWELISDFNIALSGYYNFDNRPPRESAARDDWGVVFSIGYSL